MSKKEEGEQKLPLRPRLVLRAGFAGRKELTEEETCRLKKALDEVLHTLGRRLAEIAPGVPVKAGQEPKVSTFFERRAPLLRLVTGLCEGADEVAAQVLETVKVEPDAGAACEPGRAEKGRRFVSGAIPVVRRSASRLLTRPEGLVASSTTGGRSRRGPVNESRRQEAPTFLPVLSPNAHSAPPDAR